MLESIRSFFAGHVDASVPDAAGQRDRVRIATCALLLEAAHADADFDAGEAREIGRIVARRFRLDEQHTEQLLALAEAEREEATDLYQFARLINANFTRAQKLAVVELLWQVVYSDGRLEAHEDALMHKVANLLGLQHRELIALKLRARDAHDAGAGPAAPEV